MAAATTADRGREVRQRLLRVAVELIAERGWAAVSTRILAERAGVTPGVVHYHFASVRALLSEAAVGVLRELVDQLGPALDQVRTLDEALGLMLGFLDDHDDQNPITLLFAETYLAANRDEELRHSLGEIIVAFRRRLADRLAAETVPSPEATAAVLAAALDGVMLHRSLGPTLAAADVTPVLRRLLAPAGGEHPHPRKAGEAS